jgi:putative SOS response-associated peptidase YedK
VCGRFVQTSSPDRLAAAFGATLSEVRPHVSRYNVAPGTEVHAIIDRGGRRLGRLHWGFVPSWAASPTEGPRPINARVESAATSRLFGTALAQRRCIVPADGWYEWREESGLRQPYFLRPVSGPSAIAAIWSMWRARPDAGSPDGEVAQRATVALLTTAARGVAAEVHDRMPLCVPIDLLDGWLGDTVAHADIGAIAAALVAHTPELEVTRVSRRVNSVANDDASLLAPSED